MENVSIHEIQFGSGLVKSTALFYLVCRAGPRIVM
jgi:hypothetical protein